jgi:hypothetical protein
MLHNQQVIVGIGPKNGKVNTMHLEVPIKLLNGMQVNKEWLKPGETTPMAWSPKKLGGSKRPSAKLENYV